MKLVHQVPRSTFTYLTEGFLAGDQTSLRNQVLARVPGFLSSLMESPNAEVLFLARAAVADGGSVTSENVRYVKRLTGLSPLRYGGTRLKCALPARQCPWSSTGGLASFPSSSLSVVRSIGARRTQTEWRQFWSPSAPHSLTEI